MDSSECKPRGLGFHDDEVANQLSTSNAASLATYLFNQSLAYHEDQMKVAQSQKVSFPEPESSDPLRELNRFGDMERPDEKGDIVTEVKEGRSRAIAILQRFMDIKDSHGVILSSTASGEQYREKRATFLERERQRKHQAYLKNLEYISKKEEKRLKQQLEQIQEAQEVEEHTRKRYLELQDQRKAILSPEGYQSNPRANKRQKVSQGKGSKGSTSAESLAIYLSGLPTDGSVTYETLAPFFESFGKLLKIHFYRSKSSGSLKGDALVIFQVGPQERNELLQTVCSQMNGAELPCGTIIKVQPSESEYSRLNNASTVDQLQSSIQRDSCNASQPVEAGDDQDLEDFFASL